MGPHLLASELMKEKSGETNERKLNTEASRKLPGRGAYLCFPVPMFPGTDVPRTYVPQCLCSPVPMFPGTDVPRFLYFNSGH